MVTVAVLSTVARSSSSPTSFAVSFTLTVSVTLPLVNGATPSIVHVTVCVSSS